MNSDAARVQSLEAALRDAAVSYGHNTASYHFTKHVPDPKQPHVRMPDCKEGLCPEYNAKLERWWDALTTAQEPKGEEADGELARR